MRTRANARAYKSSTGMFPNVRECLLTRAHTYARPGSPEMHADALQVVRSISRMLMALRDAPANSPGAMPGMLTVPQPGPVTPSPSPASPHSQPQQQ